MLPIKKNLCLCCEKMCAIGGASIECRCSDQICSTCYKCSPNHCSCPDSSSHARYVVWECGPTGIYQILDRLYNISLEKSENQKKLERECTRLEWTYHRNLQAWALSLRLQSAFQDELQQKELTLKADE